MDRRFLTAIPVYIPIDENLILMYIVQYLTGSGISTACLLYSHHIKGEISGQTLRTLRIFFFFEILHWYTATGEIVLRRDGDPSTIAEVDQKGMQGKSV